jgi:hypothetical protein
VTGTERPVILSAHVASETECSCPPCGNVTVPSAALCGQTG